MADRLVVGPMTQSLLVWRCLHSGKIDAGNLDHPSPNPMMDWPRLHARNVRLLRELIDAYGTCAMVAREGEAVVGTLRFYPKALCTFSDSGVGFCLQQDHPAGPSESLGAGRLPPMEELVDRTLFVHCLMIASPQGDPGRYRRKGLGSRMASALTQWGRTHGWTAVEAIAYQELATLYAISGSAGRLFWEKLGFRVVQQDTEPGIDGQILEALREDAAVAGIPESEVTNRYRMRLDLRN